VFSLLQSASLAIQNSEVDEPTLLEVVPRLADVINERPELETFKEPFSSRARSTGLWNYIDRDKADTPDTPLAESVTIPELGNITLHREQIGILHDILAGKNVIPSAPTSHLEPKQASIWTEPQSGRRNGRSRFLVTGA
jgi:hypothetical protein